MGELSRATNSQCYNIARLFPNSACLRERVEIARLYKLRRRFFDGASELRFQNYDHRSSDSFAQSEPYAHAGNPRRARAVNHPRCEASPVRDHERGVVAYRSAVGKPKPRHALP